jgi:OmcA/MtrC family decaheme c-type cytochrome
MRSRKLWFIAGACLAVGVAAGTPTHRQRFYNPHQKAYFLPDAVQFVNPGLVFSIQSASIATDGTITVNFTMADPTTLPLDRNGIQTPGTVATSFVAAAIPNGQEQYISYITRAASGAAIPTTNQPAADSGGTLTGGPGSYTYVFKAKATGFDSTATQTIGIYGSRNLTTFDLGTDYASTTFSFVPNGSKVTNVRDVIKNTSCDRCHDQLSFHGGSRRGIGLCVMCHQTQLFDPDSGNNLDFKVMIHKIHMGSSLPSVIAGKPYQIIGFQNAVSDFSDVVFPANVQRCQVCHDQTTGAAQAKNYLTQPSRATCGSCHDDVDFSSGKNHPGGAYTDDSKCSTCHVPVGSADFDASVFGAHVVPTESSFLSGLKVAITSVTGGTAGNKPTVNFTVTDNKGNGVPVSKLGALSATMAGPTTDYGYTNFGGTGTALTPGYVTESMTTAASCNTGGSCSYTFTHPVPAGSKGTFAMGIESRRSETIPNGQPGGTQSVTYGALNPVAYFSVDGSTIAPRRTVVALSNCNQCHFQLSLHGTLRNNTAYCVLCHNPSQTDAPTRPSAVDPGDKALPNQGINFNLLVHRIHFGDNAEAAGTKNPYIVVGFGGSHNDFSDVGFPAMSPQGSTGDTRNCDMCHTANSEQTLPIGKNQVVDPQGWINPNQAVAGACSGCHVSSAEASHFLANTTTLGESCTVCHSSGAAYSVAQVHAQY